VVLFSQSALLNFHLPLSANHNPLLPIFLFPPMGIAYSQLLFQPINIAFSLFSKKVMSFPHSAALILNMQTNV
jgi:hypothetical protein